MAEPKKKEGRYANPPKPMQKRSTSDPTMDQQANSAASKAAGASLKGPMSGEIDTTDPKGPTPDLDAGTEAVPVSATQAAERADMHTRHEAEMRSTHTQYEGALRDMRKRHETEISSMRSRHEGSVASEGATKAKGTGKPAGGL